MGDFIKTHAAFAALAVGIKPADIKYEEGRKDKLEAKFAKAEVEENVGKLIRFFQVRGNWAPFKLAELEAFYNQVGWPSLSGENIGIFFGLAEPWFDMGSTNPRRGDFLRLKSDGRVGVTDEFVLRCAGYSPDRLSALKREAA